MAIGAARFTGVYYQTITVPHDIKTTDADAVSLVSTLVCITNDVPHVLRIVWMVFQTWILRDSRWMGLHHIGWP